MPAYGKRPRLPYVGPASMNVGFGFDAVLKWLQGGRKVTRRGWNGQGMYIYLVQEREMVVGETDETTMLIGVKPEGLPITMAARIDMQYADGKIGIWSPSHEDLLANDWNLLQ